MKCVFTRMLVVVITFLWYQSVFCGDYIRSSYVTNLESCSLGDFSWQNVTESELHCTFACLHKKCAAYQWDAASGSCDMQDRLHITTSASDEDTVGLMMGDEDLPVTCATDCADILARDPSSESGVYYIIVGGQLLKQVWCDMDTDGGGWTVFLKRLDGSVDFYQDHAAYKEGFGDVNGEYWFGLEALHAMTSANTYKFRVDVSDWDDVTGYSLHESMLVADGTKNFQLTLGDFLEGDLGTCLDYNKGAPFSTRDVELDTEPNINCAVRHHGVWWYKACSNCHPTAKYYYGGTYASDNNDGIQWRSWPEHHDERYYSMKTLEMKLRP